MQELPPVDGQPSVHRRTCTIEEIAPMPHPVHWKYLLQMIDQTAESREIELPWMTSTREYIKENLMPEAERQFLVD